LRVDDDVYKPRQDQSVTVTFPLRGEKAQAAELEGVLALAWTTTPWTLPTNAALAVGPEITYALVPAGPDAIHPGATYLLAEDTIVNYRKELGYAEVADATAAITRRIPGSELGGIHYERVFDYYADREAWGLENAWQILVAEYVATGEGTGIVHQAPAYGEDDQVTCAEAGIPVVISVDDAGRFLEQVTDVAGLQVFDANKTLTGLLRSSGRLFAERSYDHSYPHCWRCRTPLIYKAVSSWFVRVTEIRDRMLELNEEITWVPANVKDGQFGKWLSNARDWSISRNRYWGSPIPVWKSDNPDFPRIDVYGSLEELERDFGVKPEDLHRPAIDELVRPNPDDPSGASMMRRIPDVLDVWFDSGSMPFAQVHYPFENHEWFDSHNPSDFIVEYIGQTRGWFYTMHILATALFDRPAFKQVISHGIVLGSDGQKMSKSLRNYPDVSEVFERDGADAMRWFLMSSSVIRGGNLVVTEEGIREAVRQFMLPYWSTYYFLSLYVGDHTPVWRTDSTHVLDRYILAKTKNLIQVTTQEFEALDSPMAAAALRDFADVLTNWYVRRSRERFWDGTDKDALDTLYTVLETISRLAAPLAPLVTEEVWRGLTGGESVHLTDWPEESEFPGDDDLVSAMDTVRDVASAGLALRKAHGLRVRLPLNTLTIVTEGVAGVEGFLDILADELNVKEVTTRELDDQVAKELGIGKKLLPQSRVLGPRVGSQVQSIIQAAKAGDWSLEGGVVTVAGLALEEGEYVLEFTSEGEDTAVQFLGSGGFVLLDTTVTPELAAEGLARDVIRAIQQERKNAGLEVSDRIQTVLEVDEVAGDAIRTHQELIASETLSLGIELTELEDTEGALAVGENSKIRVKVSQSV
jgi:isoleucyl-tRNA synthetase